MLVDRDTRGALASEGDVAGVLKSADGRLFTGTLPADLPLANTSVDFGGKRWAMALLPLPVDQRQRGVLLAHEAFHRVQPQLGLSTAAEGRNGHLDREQGRLWLQMELRALDRALADAAVGRDPRIAARDALLFRAERRRQFRAAAADEALLERSEGTAEYTGIVAAEPDRSKRATLARGNLAKLPERPSFSRVFAYSTGPAYGLLLDGLVGPGWRRRFLAGATFDGLLEPAVGGQVGVAARTRAAVYGGEALAEAERTRERSRLKREAELRASLVDGPVLVVPITGSISFDPGTVTVLEGSGIVYGGLKTAGTWGGLESSSPALVAPDWTNVRVAGPAKVNGATASGPGWRLMLNPGWRVKAGARGQQTIERIEESAK